MGGEAGIPTVDPAFTTLGDLKMCRVLNGMWQVSGAHGYYPNKEESVAAMTRCAAQGYTTFDLADIYGPAEDYVGAFLKDKKLKSDIAKDCQFFTKWVPRPAQITQVWDDSNHALNDHSF